MPMASRPPTLEIERDLNLAQIVIHQPILEVSLLDRLVSGLEDLASERPVPLVIRSAHPTVFLAGAHLREIAELDAHSCTEYARRGRRVIDRLNRHPAPTVAAVHGSCSGGGFDLVLACDAIVANPNAVFQHPGIRRGLVTGWSGTAVLPQALGPSQVRRALLEGQAIGSIAMRDLGLVHSIADETALSATEVAVFLGSIDRDRLLIWRALRGPGFVDRFRATMVHKL
jgi:enoyl-CoA hydratase/carnithine racemase